MPSPDRSQKIHRREAPTIGGAPGVATSAQACASGDTIMPSFGERILFGCLLTWTFLALCFPLYDTDFWWHLKTGELILREGRLPQVDWYTFTDFDKPWIDLHWGFQILVTLLWRVGGADAVILVKAAIITSAVAVAWRAGGGHLPVWGKTALWILPIVCISGRGYERPEMLSLFFLAVWLWLVRHVERRTGIIWVLPVVQLVWVNCHALFVLGLVVGFCYAIDCLAREFAQGRWGLAYPVQNPSSRATLWAGLLVVGACFLNPYFEEGAFFPLTLYRKFSDEQDFYSKNIGEFQRPIDFAKTAGWLAAENIYFVAEVAVWSLTAASFVWLYKRRGRWSVLRLMLFAGFSQLAWKATRNTNIFALVSGFVVSENVAEALAIENRPVWDTKTRYATWMMEAVVAALIVAVVTGWWNNLGDANKPFGLGEARGWYIHDAARFTGREGFPRRALVSNIGQAAVYSYHNARQRLVFMDGRLEVCTRQTFELYNDILDRMARADPGWQAVFTANAGELPVVILDSRFSRPQIRGMAQTAGWRLVFADRSAAVFLSSDQADKLSLPEADPEPLRFPDGPPRNR